MTKALILGGSGFIGLSLVRALLARGRDSVIAVDDQSRGALDAEAKAVFEDARVTFIAADLTDPAAFDRLPTDIDEIYLLAGIVGVKYTIEAPDRVLRVSAMIILNTLEWWRRHGKGRLLYSSSSEAYGGGLPVLPNFPIPTPEGAPIIIPDITNVRFSYAAVKTFGEACIQAYAQRYRLPAVVVRYHNVYGPRMGYEHVIPELSLRLLRAERPFLLYGADQTRAFCHVSDAVAATIAAMTHADAHPPIYHIGNETEEVRIAELFDRLQAVAGIRARDVKLLDAPRGSPQRRCPDTTRMRKELHIEPKIGLDDGMRATFAWYRDRHPDGRIPAGR